MEADELVETGLKWSEKNLSFLPDCGLIVLDKDWEKECRKRGIEGESFFDPVEMKAYLYSGSKNFAQNLFHEYFGHGLFCTHVPIGKFITSMMKRKNAIKKDIGKKDYAEIKRLVSEDLHLDGVIENSGVLKRYEGFADWMAEKLCSYVGVGNHLDDARAELLDSNLMKEHQFGLNGLLYETGFPKDFNIDKIDEILLKRFKEKYVKSDMALLYGSMLPHSDIDIFIVSDEMEPYFNGWLDINVIDKKNFEKALNFMDISITDPLFSGKILRGKNAAEKSRKTVHDAKITDKMIRFNEEMAKVQDEVAVMSFLNYGESKKARRYEFSFSTNAKALKEGKKLLTLEGALRYHRS